MLRRSSLAVAALAASVTAQFTVVVPNGFAATEGNSSNAFPWGRTGIGLRHQCIYDSTHFTNQGINVPILITGLKWRPNSNVALANSSYTSGCTVALSTCPVDQAAVAASFASNQGTDLTTVFSGPVSWNTQAPQVGPSPFGISIPFTTNFLYDPNFGDLNVECDLPIQTFTGAGPQLDVEAGAQTSRASRVFMSTGYPSGQTFVNTNHAVVIEVTYLPAVGYGIASTYGTGCANVDVSSYELFASASAFDLSNSAITLLHTGTGYVAMPGTTVFVPPSPAANTLTLGNNGEEHVTISAPMSVGAAGTTTELTICSNGFVSAGPGNGTASTPTAATFLNGPRAWWSIAWHDYDPSIAGSGVIKAEQAFGVLFVTWIGVWDAGGTSAANANTMQAQFEIATGNVHYVYRTMSTVGGTGFLVGYSGGGASADPGSMDISAALPATYQAAVFAASALAHTASARPVIGTSINLVTSNIPITGVLGLTMLGTTEFTTGIGLTFLGMPSCALYTSLDATLVFPPAGSSSNTALPIPASPALAGAVVLTQGAVAAPGINPFGFITSNGVRLTLDLN